MTVVHVNTKSAKHYVQHSLMRFHVTATGDRCGLRSQRIGCEKKMITRLVLAHRLTYGNDCPAARHRYRAVSESYPEMSVIKLTPNSHLVIRIFRLLCFPIAGRRRRHRNRPRYQLRIYREFDRRANDFSQSLFWRVARCAALAYPCPMMMFEQLSCTAN